MRTSMRHPAVALFGLALAAPALCVTLPDRIFPANFEAAPDCLPAGSTGCPGFVIATYVPIDPGQAISLCYYFRTGSAGAIGVGRFSSRLGPAVHNIAVYTTADSTTQLPADRQPPGTLTSTGCGFGTGDNIADRRIYSAHQAAEQLRMPDDDGAGRPLAIELPANAAGYIEMYLLNASEQSVMTYVELTANGRAEAQPYTKTATYLAYNTQISIPPLGSATATQSCGVPDPAKFWWFSTETHRRAATATLRNGAATILVTSNWEAPAIATFAGPSFYSFASGEKLTYECSYNNDRPFTTTTGNNYETDEVCIGVGYYFPAGKAYCFNSVGPL